MRKPNSSDVRLHNRTGDQERFIFAPAIKIRHELHGRRHALM
jgi:hypothetical protein